MQNGLKIFCFWGKTVVFSIIFLTHYSCTSSTEIKDVPNIFVGDFCMNDILTDGKFILRISNNTITESTKEGGGDWEVHKTNIIKIISKEWNRIMVYTKTSGDNETFSRYEFQIKAGHLIAYSGLLYGANAEDDIAGKDQDWIDSKIGDLFKCN